MDDKERQAVFIAALTTKHFVLQTAASVTVSTEMSTLMGERGERVRDPLSTRRKESRLALGSDGHNGIWFQHGGASAVEVWYGQTLATGQSAVHRSPRSRPCAEADWHCARHCWWGGTALSGRVSRSRKRGETRGKLARIDDLS